MTPPTQGYTQLVVRSLARPYRVTASMVLLVCLVPLYIFIAEMIPAKRCYVPEIPFDRALPLLPVWVLIYGAFYLFLIVLPVLVVRQDALIRRTVWAYLSVWIIAYVCFIFLPTVAPRPTHLIGRGFALDRKSVV